MSVDAFEILSKLPNDLMNKVVDYVPKPIIEKKIECIPTLYKLGSCCIEVGASPYRYMRSEGKIYRFQDVEYKRFQILVPIELHHGNDPYNYTDMSVVETPKQVRFNYRDSHNPKKQTDIYMKNKFTPLCEGIGYLNKKNRFNGHIFNVDKEAVSQKICKFKVWSLFGEAEVPVLLPWNDYFEEDLPKVGTDTHTTSELVYNPSN